MSRISREVDQCGVCEEQNARTGFAGLPPKENTKEIKSGAEKTEADAIDKESLWAGPNLPMRPKTT